jgi:uncharacterized OsmC-like protein
MTDLRDTFERSSRALRLRPSLGRSTGMSRARIRHGLTCEIEDGNWKLTADMPAQAGGGGTAPTPGVFGRAALGSCLAITYAMYAAKLGVSIAEIDVEVQADYDDGALFGVSDSPPGYLDVRYTVTITSDAPAADILRVLDEGDAHSPYLDVFRRGQACHRDVRIVNRDLPSASEANRDLP